MKKCLIYMISVVLITVMLKSNVILGSQKNNEIFFEEDHFSCKIIGDNQIQIYDYDLVYDEMNVPNNLIHKGIKYRVTEFYWNQSTTSIHKIILNDGIKRVWINPEGDYNTLLPNLQELILPASLEYINRGFSFTMTNLKSIKLPDSNKYYKAVDNVLFNKSGTDLIAYPSGDERTSYHIPSGVQTIKKEAFASNQNLKELSIPDSVTELESWTFSGSHIETLDLSPVKKAGKGTFAFCSDLKEIKLGKETALDKEQFYENSALKKISVEEGNSKLWSQDGILYSHSDEGKSLVCYPSAKEEVCYAVPAGISRVDYSAFNMCRLERVYLPASVKKIQGSAFNYGNEGKAENAIEIYLCRDSLPEMKKASFADLASGSTIYLKNQTLREQFEAGNEKYQYIDHQDKDAKIKVSAMEQQPAEDIVLDKDEISFEMKRDGNQLTDLLGVSLVPPACTDQIMFSTSDSKVAKVSDSGEITAVSPGSVSITVQSGSARKECRATVYGPLGSVDKIPMQFYAGLEVRPDPVVRNMNGEVLRPGTDYIVRYEKNTVPGMAKVLIQGIGFFRGGVETDFEIRIKENDISRAEVIFPQKFYYYEGKPVRPKPTVNLDGKKLVEGRDYRIEYMANGEVGLGCVWLTGIGGYYGQNFSYFQIMKKEEYKKEQKPAEKKYKISSVSQPSNSVYTGKTVTRSVKVKSGARVLKINRDYRVIYSSNKNCGRARMEVLGKGSYTGKTVRYFMIIPKKTSIKKIRSGKRNIKLYLKKSPGKATGYQVSWAVNKKFLRTKIRSVRKTTCLLKGLKSRRYYYIKVRAYKTVQGKKYFGGYSKTKKVRVK